MSLESVNVLRAEEGVHDAQHEVNAPDGQEQVAAGSGTQVQGQIQDQDRDGVEIGERSKYSLLFTLQGHKRSVSSLSISPDGQQLVSAGADGLLKIWSVATGAVVATLDAAEAIAASASASAASMMIDDEELENAAEDDVLAAAARLRLGICDIAWSMDSRYLVCGGDDCVVRMWDTTSQSLVRQFTGHTSFVFCVAFHPNTTLAVSGSFDETVRLWNIQRNTCHRTISAHSEAVTAVDFNLDGSILASSSYDGLIRLWDSYTGQCLKTLVYGEAPPVGHILFSPNSFQLLATSLDNTIRLWDIANSRVVKTYTGHHNEKYALKASFTSTTTPTATASHAMQKEQATSPQIMIVAGSEDHRVYLWDLQSKKVVQTLTGHKDATLAVATHPTLPIIASASLDHDPCIKVWKLTDRTSTGSLHGSIMR